MRSGRQRCEERLSIRAVQAVERAKDIARRRAHLGTGVAQGPLEALPRHVQAVMRLHLRALVPMHLQNEVDVLAHVHARRHALVLQTGIEGLPVHVAHGEACEDRIDGDLAGGCDQLFRDACHAQQCCEPGIHDRMLEVCAERQGQLPDQRNRVHRERRA